MDPWDELLNQCRGHVLLRPLLLAVVVCVAIGVLGGVAKAGPNDKRQAVDAILCCGGR
jgi:hypothetical protein